METSPKCMFGSLPRNVDVSENILETQSPQDMELQVPSMLGPHVADLVSVYSPVLCSAEPCLTSCHGHSFHILQIQSVSM